MLYCRFQQMRGGLSPAEYTEEIALVKNTLVQEPAPHWAEYLAAFDA